MLYRCAQNCGGKFELFRDATGKMLAQFQSASLGQARSSIAEKALLRATTSDRTPNQHLIERPSQSSSGQPVAFSTEDCPTN